MERVSIEKPVETAYDIDEELEKLYGAIGEAKSEKKSEPSKAGRKSNRPDKEKLEKLYIENGLTIKAIGERFGVSESAAYGWLNQYGIPRRPRGGNKKGEKKMEKVQEAKVETAESQKVENVPDMSCPVNKIQKGSVE